MNTYLVLETENVIGKVAYVKTVSNTDNLKKYINDKKIISINAYSVKKQALKQAEILNEIYKERGWEDERY